MITDSQTLEHTLPRVTSSTAADPVIDDEMARTLIGDNADCDLMIGRVPLPRSAETGHILLAGGAGTAKVDAMHQLLNAIAQRGDTAVVYDAAGIFVPRHYRPERGDQLLNPLDRRSPAWSLADEIDTKEPAKTIGDRAVEADTPIDGSAFGPRDMLAETIGMLGEATDGTMYHLFRATTGGVKAPDIFRSARAGVTEFGSEPASGRKSKVALALAETGERRTLRRRRRTTAARNAFTIGGFLQAADMRGGEMARPWLFIPPWPAEHDALRPLFMEMVDAALTAALDQRLRPQRRIWVIIDDLDALKQPPLLVSGLMRSHARAVSIIAGISDTTGMMGGGGLEFASDIWARFQTIAVFRLEDRLSASEASTLMGMGRQQLEGGEPWPGETYVPAADIVSLPDQACFIRVPGPYPIIRTHVDAQYEGEGAARHAAFEDAAIEETIATALIRLYENAVRTNVEDANHTPDQDRFDNAGHGEAPKTPSITTGLTMVDDRTADAVGPLCQLVRNLRCIQRAAGALEKAMSNLRAENKLLKQMLVGAAALLFLISIGTGMAWREVCDLKAGGSALVPDDAPAFRLRAPPSEIPAPPYLQDAPGTIRVGSAGRSKANLTRQDRRGNAAITAPRNSKPRMDTTP